MTEFAYRCLYVHLQYIGPYRRILSYPSERVNISDRCSFYDCYRVKMLLTLLQHPL